MRRPPVPVVGAAGAGLVAGGAAAVALAAGAPGAVVGTLAGVALVALGAAVVGVGVWLPVPEHDEQERHARGPRLDRRHLVVGAGLGAVAVTAVSIPARRRIDDVSDRLRRTSWAPGIRVVNERGEPVRADGVATGELLTVHPEGAENDVDSQAVLVREVPSRIVAEEGREDWAPEGLLVYSKLCTHMACPVGLYQQRDGTLLCPCHQALFDVRRGGRAVHGPARRPLPQLPVAVDERGYLVARGDFSDAVGTGFWGRP